MRPAARSAALQVLPPRLAARLQARRAGRRLLRYEPRVVHHDYCGYPMSIHIEDAVASRWNDHDWPELPEIALLQRHGLRTGATVFDLGAHQCVVALVLAHIVGPPGRVVAVEPDPRLAGLGLRNQLRNRVRQLTILNAAAGGRTGTITFNPVTGRVQLRAPYPATVSVPCVTIDELSRTFGTPDILFVDVEGFECDVLSGATETLAARPDCFVEIHLGGLLEGFGGSFDDVLGHFPADGYDVYVDDAPGSEGHAFARWPASDGTPEGPCNLVAIARS